jgi:hypothetical protein
MTLVPPEGKKVMHAELKTLFEADQAERQNHPFYGTSEYWELRARDTHRRQRVTELIAKGALKTAEDYHHAALIFQHGEEVQEIWRAHTLAMKAVEMDYVPARWMAAATLDRWLMYQGKPQKYGTQFVPDGKQYRLWDLDPTTSDAERAAWDVPSLAEQQQRAQKFTEEDPQPPMDDAPWWLKDALKRWEQETS